MIKAINLSTYQYDMERYNNNYKNVNKFLEDNNINAIEEETLNIVRENKEDRNLSSDSASLERIVLEWAVLKGNNNGTSNVHSNIDINKIVEKVLDRLQEDNKKKCEEISVDKENTDYENSINELLNDIPD